MRIAKLPTPPEAPMMSTVCPAWTLPLSRRSDLLDDAGDVDARDRVLRPPDPRRETDHPRSSLEHVHVAGEDRGGADAHEDLPAPGLGPRDLAEAQDVG
jgi:hypothetical protein